MLSSGSALLRLSTMVSCISKVLALSAAVLAGELLSPPEGALEEEFSVRKRVTVLSCLTRPELHREMCSFWRARLRLL